MLLHLQRLIGYSLPTYLQQGCNLSADFDDKTMNDSNENTQDQPDAEVPQQAPQSSNAPLASQQAPQAQQPAPGLDLRRRLRELLSVPESQRSDAVWDEIIELEIQLAPGNRIGGVAPKQNERGGGQRGGGGIGGGGGGAPGGGNPGGGNWKRHAGPSRKHPKPGGPKKPPQAP